MSDVDRADESSVDGDLSAECDGESVVQVTFRLYGLGRQVRQPSGTPFSRIFRSGTTVEEALHTLGIRHEAEVSVLIAGRVASPERRLEPGDELVVVPPLVGG